MENYTDTILSQYANSPTICSLIETFNDAIDPATDLDSVFSYIWDVDTAQGFGLDILGKIVNISRLLTVNSTPLYFGFGEAATNLSTNNPEPFGQGVFYSGLQSTSTVELADDAYRQLIIAKAMFNITDCSIPNINKILRWLFSSSGTAFVVDAGNMQLRYTFLFDLTPVQLAIVTCGKVLPRPCGVLATALIINPNSTFGFGEAGAQPFGQGVFFNPSQGLQNAS
jgi:hypothetical protein